MISGLPDGDALRALVERALALPGLAAQAERLQRLTDDYARGVASESRALVVALVGATGAGKSTLLNALIGAAVAEPGDARPTTRQAVVYAPEDAAIGSLAALGAQVVRYRPGAPGPWSGHVLVDTPDLNSVVPEHRERARRVVEQADVALVVLHKGSVAEAVQAQFLRTFAQRRLLLFVLNHADLLSAQAQATLKAQVRELAQAHLSLPDAEVFAVSALAWQQGRAEAGERALLLEALRRLGERSERERVLRSNALGALRELQALVRPELERADAASERRAKLLAEGLGAARATLSEDFAARLEAASAHLGHAVRAEASRRLWGPAGWWMRLTLAGTSGVGAAALLARGSPLLAGGLAAGSALASRVQKHVLERSAAGRMEAEPGADEASLAAAHVAVAAARGDAAQEGSLAAEAHLPEAAALAEAFAQLRAAAWEQTSGLALAEAVQRWWRVARFVLLPVVNLPLLALFGHVAYRLVRGYLEGAYVGADFLLNALALAALLAGAGAGLASLSLYGVRRRVAAGGRRRFEASLQELSARLVASARDGERGARSAARGLVELLPA